VRKTQYVIVACRRLAAGRKPRPTAAIVGTPSVKAGPRRGPRGQDANKKVEGRKRVLMVDTQGDRLGGRVAPAKVQERGALQALAPDLGLRASLLLVWLDRALAGDEPAFFLRGYGTAELVGTRGRQEFRVEPRRWKVEQTFRRRQRYRRLRVGGAMSPGTSRQMTVLASVFMSGMRLQRILQTSRLQAGSKTPGLEVIDSRHPRLMCRSSARR
jgi:transposase